ncbi:2Fe-2S iron-sulfur cluster-binding protein [Paraburkholderia mimosarum]|uniref:2Fe-2S iron-sulfur cluster-binding protein n=2 Tax=Paraburkholderia mimosarum TaxID=312026 RepID=UPI00041F2CAC|nr:2Fe-2S iron-sulfur cluster-binding protein [Paraburkholderia mimosarum]
MSEIRLMPSGKTVDCLPGDTVLQALERKGYALPNNCRAGACGECKVKVRSGEFDQGLVLDMALSQEERQQGYGLMCMAKPLSKTLEIEWDFDGSRPRLFPPKEAMTYILVDRIRRTERIVELRLRPVEPVMRFWPGQYVTLGDHFSGAPARCYSIANAPRPDGEIALQVTRLDGGATSVWIHEQLKVGDVVRLSGPYGTFIGDPSSETPVLCMAAGSGLAPILSLTEAALRRGYKQPVTLLFSARTPGDVYGSGVLGYWQSLYRNFRYIPTLTRSEAPGFRSGRIPALLPALFPDLSAYSVFIAGSPDFTEACAAQAKALGAKSDLIHSEGYVSQGR